ncbi:MAG: deacetylase [Myxococcaceae bacterium]
MQPARVQSRLFHTYRRLDGSLLAADEEVPLGAEALALERREGRTGLVFGTYSRAGLENALRAYGTLERLEAIGLGRIDVRLDLTDAYRPRIRLESRLFAGRPCLEVELREASGAAVGLPRAASDVRVLYLESLLLQHPGRSFDWSRPPLPEQEFPGLSLSGEALQILLLLAKRVGAEAMALRPSTFHAASIYSKYFHFVDGRAEGRLEALRAERRLRPLWLLSWALELGCVRRQGERVTFSPDVMLAPLSRRATTHFSTRSWKRAFLLGRAERHVLDVACLRERFPLSSMPSGRPPAFLQKLLQAPER